MDTELIVMDVVVDSSIDEEVTGGIRPYAPRQARYDTWYEGIPRGK
jgi:hypothetical protein